MYCNLVEMFSRASFVFGNFVGCFVKMSLVSCLRIPTPKGALYSGRTSLKTRTVACFCFLKRYSVIAILTA